MRTATIFLSVFVSFGFVCSAQAKPALTIKVSNGISAGVNADSYAPEISGNGRYIIYRSVGSNIVTGDVLNKTDVFLFRVIDETTRRISVSTIGAEADNNSYPAAISRTGRYALISSDATNLVSNDTNGARDAFLIDTKLDGIQRVSLGNDGSEANSTSTAYDVSDNGRYVLFGSADDDLVDNDNNGFHDVFLRDLQLGTTTLISASRSGIPTDTCYTRNPAMGSRSSARYIMFFCEHSAGLNDEATIFRYDRKTGTTVMVSVDSSGNQVNAAIDPAAMSSNGRYVVFTTDAQLVPEDINALRDVYIRDIKKQTTKLAVTGLNGTLPNAEVIFHDMTPDARYLAIVSGATNLDTLANPSAIVHAYRYDRKKKKAVRASLSVDGTSGDIDTYSAVISTSGKRMSFDSGATNLVDNDTNAFDDVFMRTVKITGTGN